MTAAPHAVFTVTADKMRKEGIEIKRDDMIELKFEAPLLTLAKVDIVGALRCQCGAEACGSPNHSDWCQKYAL
jgi:hypothetical protein